MSKDSKTSILIDAETLCLKPTAVITEIGIIAFNRADFTVIDEVNIVPDLFYQIVAGRTISASTIEFHRKKGTLPESTRGLSPIATVFAIQQFVEKHNPRRVWIQGTDFDRPLVENFCEFAAQPLPWYYKKSSDARTLWDTAFPDKEHDSRPHRAIPDCHATLADLVKTLTALNCLNAA